ncbi:MAG: nucleotidyl transferase AbiEii/AbiGii toxin family protein [Lentisphaeria bacterium]|nr:nucleotidyl transferase AbiEii/AbiGii toxin family protein [Lentisphaeria bacterium]
MIEEVAAGLVPLLDSVVFIGGASSCLLIDDTIASGVRPTDDVDCIVEVGSRAEYSKLEAQLRSLGFSHAMAEDAPMCRWIYRGVLVDVMPDDRAILGFSNAWYKEGIAHAQEVTLPSGLLIRCLTLPYFVATKIEAFLSRGGDFRMSHDIEDIVIVLDGQRDLAALGHGPESVVGYLRGKFVGFLADSNFIESLYAHLPLDSRVLGRQKQITAFLESFARPR